MDMTQETNEMLAMRADISRLCSTVGGLAEDVRDLKENGLQVRLDIARYKGALAGGITVMSALFAGITWLLNHVG